MHLVKVPEWRTQTELKLLAQVKEQDFIVRQSANPGATLLKKGQGCLSEIPKETNLDMAQPFFDP